MILPFGQPESSNDTHFIATDEWQEIKPGKNCEFRHFHQRSNLLKLKFHNSILGQQVPSGLHYRMNLQTGYKEAKILVEENDKTDMQAVPQDETATKDDENSDVVVENSRQRLEEALKNVPANVYDSSHTDEEWKKITEKYKSYKELKEDLKELELGMKSENEIMNELVARFGDETSTIEDKLIILEDIEYLVHSLDNALHFISIGALEKVIVPFFNHTNVKIRAECFKIVGTVLQNNNVAKQYASEKTNIGENLVSSLASELINTHHEAIGPLLFAYGSFMRNNIKVSLDYNKKGLGILMQIITSDNSKFSLSMKTKALVLITDIIRDQNWKSELEAYINGSEVCNQLDKFFSLNRNGFVADVDATSKLIASVVDIQDICRTTWSESGTLRHNLLVLLSYHRSWLSDESNEDLRDAASDIVGQLDKLNQYLYGHLTIKEDDLSDQYEKEKTIKTELWRSNV